MTKEYPVPYPRKPLIEDYRSLSTFYTALKHWNTKVSAKEQIAYNRDNKK